LNDVQDEQGIVANGCDIKARALVKSGVFVAVAAGNELTDVEDSSPAGEPLVCTVGATNQTDEFAYFSNYGNGVGMFN
jgi:subtilisin family serine protease